MALPVTGTSQFGEQHQIGANVNQYVASPAPVVFSDFNFQDKSEVYLDFQSEQWSPPDSAASEQMFLSLQGSNPGNVFQYISSPANVVYADFSGFERRVLCFEPIPIPYSAPGSKRSGIFLPVILRILAEEQK